MKTLVYIASTGYSGSTLLESILGSNARCLNLGEIYKLPYWPICSCGEKVDDCGFWKELRARLASRPDGATRNLRDWHVQGRRAKSGLQKHIHNAFIALGGPGSLELFCALSREVRNFRDGCARALDLFDTAAAMTGASVVIDSSKDPVYLRHLHALAPERLRVIHLVRDPRAVAHSFVKNFDRDGVTYASEASGRRPSYAEGAAFWAARNRNIGLALQRLPAAHQLLLRYEDLCLQPAAAAEQLSRFIGEDIAIPEIIHLRQQHTIAGNPMRQSETSVRVGLVEDWCARIPAGEAPHIRAAAGRLADQYGYAI
jgi:hypothetical protein